MNGFRTEAIILETLSINSPSRKIQVKQPSHDENLPVTGHFSDPTNRSLVACSGRMLCADCGIRLWSESSSQTGSLMLLWVHLHDVLIWGVSHIVWSYPPSIAGCYMILCEAAAAVPKILRCLIEDCLCQPVVAVSSFLIYEETGREMTVDCLLLILDACVGVSVLTRMTNEFRICL